MTYIPTYQSPAIAPSTVSASAGARWSLRLAGPLVWGWAAALTCLVLILIGALVGGVVGSLMALFAAVFLSFTLTYGARAIRRARGSVILGYLESAARLNLPLGSFLRAAAQGERRITRRRLLMVAGDLDSGASVGQALLRCPQEITPEIAELLTSSESIGALQPALTRLVSRQTHDVSPVPPSQVAANAYPITVCLTALALVVVLMFLVMPKFQEIFRDFKTTLPPLTQKLLAITDGAEAFYGDALALPAIGLAIVFLLARALRFTFTPWWPSLMFGPLKERLSWRVPFWRALRWHGALADICQLLADALRAGVPMPAALDEASRLYIGRELRRRILDWRTAIVDGAAISDAAASARLPKVIVGFLSTTQTPGKMADPQALIGALEFLSRYYRIRFSRLAVLLASVAEPLTTLCLATIVAAIILAVFLPLAKLINSLSGSGPGGWL